MFFLLIISTLALIASNSASGIGHAHFLPASVVKSFPVVRYAPFYNFPNGVRSIHAVAPPAIAPAHFLPAQVAPPLPAPVQPALKPFLPAPAQLLPAPAPFLPAPAPVFPAPLAAPAPFFTPALPRYAPTVPALTQLYPRAVPALPSVPFSPIIRAVSPPLPTPVGLAPAPFPIGLPPAPVPVARAVPLGLPVPNHLHLYNRLVGSSLVAPAPQAWK